MKQILNSNVTRPTYRYLLGYALDPGFSTKLDTAPINVVVYKIPFEDLEPGPIGEYLEVMDFDPASKCWYEPVDLREERIASQQGHTPSEGNPQFHQQFVYAVVMKTIRHFERALGRKIVWFPRTKYVKGVREDVYVQQLRIYPHGFRDANAYYDPDKTALLFGYFSAAHQFQGANYPGGLVFTCLSPDIVAHEATHAILDSIHHRYMEDTNPDVAAFHEAFADIVALLQRFTFRELVEHQLFAAGGKLENFSVLGELATQFGEALEGNRGALRNMIGRWEGDTWVPLKPSPSDYQDNREAHARGAVLVATIFDVFQRIYRFRTQDLIRIASNGTGRLPEGSISRDLVHRLAVEASEIAEHLLHICIRALDYSPPNDISFGDYLRALITADLDIAPEDENRYRLALIEAFRARGIFPDRVNTLSEESLCWYRPQFTSQEAQAINWIAGELKPLIRELVEAQDRRTLDEHSKKARKKLNQLLMGKQPLFLQDSNWEKFLHKLGLTSLPVSQCFGDDSASVKFLDQDGKPNRNYVPKIEVHTLRPAFRAGREGRQVEQVVVTLTQRIKADIGSDEDVRPMVFRGGCTLILSLGKLNEVEYIIVKGITSYRRFREQADYLNGVDDAGAIPATALYSDGSHDPRLNFNLLHRH
ncbi:MAG TPA: hypothetical protein VGO11_08875 [Chthoniobacteraceae bacterium]|jgi:hypothetical protein|nr:hypothetical protein [Chthoniobacteraceae bacterium]